MIMENECPHCKSTHTIPYEPRLNNGKMFCLKCSGVFVIYKFEGDVLSGNLIDEGPDYNTREGSTKEFKSAKALEVDIASTSFSDLRMRRHFSNCRKINLCSFFILPLMDLNRQSFDLRFFINSYLSPDGNYIYLLLKRGYSMDQQMTWRYQVSGVFTDGRGKQMLKLRIPKEIIADVKLFIQGRYS